VTNNPLRYLDPMGTTALRVTRAVNAQYSSNGSLSSALTQSGSYVTQEPELWAGKYNISQMTESTQINFMSGVVKREIDLMENPIEPLSEIDVWRNIVNDSIMRSGQSYANSFEIAPITISDSFIAKTNNHLTKSNVTTLIMSKKTQFAVLEDKREFGYLSTNLKLGYGQLPRITIDTPKKKGQRIGKTGIKGEIIWTTIKGAGKIKLPNGDNIIGDFKLGAFGVEATYQCDPDKIKGGKICTAGFGLAVGYGVGLKYRWHSSDE